MIRAPGSNGRKVASDGAWQPGREQSRLRGSRRQTAANQAERSPSEREFGERSPWGTKASGKKASSRTAAKGRRQREKDPAGGLTVAGRAAFARKEGSHLRPGVKGKVGTPEKQKRKGSFLRRHFAHPRGPMVTDAEPTRLALSAHAWGEPVPRTMTHAAKLAGRGRDCWSSTGGRRSRRRTVGH
jgi:hypothetical protein